MTALQTPDKSTLGKLVESLPAPVFLAGMDEDARPCLTLHTTKAGAGRTLRDEMGRALAGAGIKVRCKIKEHNPKRLERSASLEQLVRRFRHGSIVFDPTGALRRAQAVIRCAENIRRTLGGGLAGVYLEPWRRTLYVVLHREAVMRDGKLAPNRVKEIECSLAEAVSQALGRDAGSVSLAVRVGFALPKIPVVPVDHASLRAGRGKPDVLRKLRSDSIAAAVAAFFGLGVAGTAMAEGPAVSAPNAKISAGGGAADDEGTGIVQGSATFPLGTSYGVQIDALGGATGDDARWGIGGQVFWRDPEEGLLGILSSFSSRGSTDVSRVGVEGEWYLGRITASARGGYQLGDGDADDGGFGVIDLRWYATDNFFLSAGGEVESGDGVARFGTEYQPGFSALPGLSFFADGEIGEDDFDRVFVGIRYYFGATKPLIRRHREDDPPNPLDDDAFALREQERGYGGRES